jgi:hypothetical protein
MSADRARARLLLSLGAAFGVGLAVRAVRSAPPRDGGLRAFYDAHTELFARAGRVRVEGVFFAGDPASAVARAEAARGALAAGKAFATVSATSDSPPAEVPGEPVSLTGVADTLGYAVALAVDAQPPGGVTPPIAVAGGAWVVRVTEREPARIAPFEEARDEVRAEWARARARGP